jgi:CheY-like chemotaxis protein
MEITLVLSVGLDPELLGSRNVVLQSVGYTVVRAYSLNAAMDCFQTFDFDAILLCQSIPANEKDRLTSWIRATGSRIPVVSVSSNLRQGDPFADATVDSDPEILLKGMSEVLTKAANRATWTPSSCHKKDAVVLPPNVFAAAQSKKTPKSNVDNELRKKVANDVRSLYCM